MDGLGKDILQKNSYGVCDTDCGAGKLGVGRQWILGARRAEAVEKKLIIPDGGAGGGGRGLGPPVVVARDNCENHGLSTGRGILR
jgi:hypothetical protein